MSAQRLVEMVNDIAANQVALPHEEAVELIAVHLRRFWAPSMRAGIIGHLDGGGEGLSTLGREAVDALREHERAGDPIPPTRRGVSDAG